MLPPIWAIWFLLMGVYRFSAACMEAARTKAVLCVMSVDLASSQLFNFEALGAARRHSVNAVPQPMQSSKYLFFTWTLGAAEDKE